MPKQNSIGNSPKCLSSIKLRDMRRTFFGSVRSVILETPEDIDEVKSKLKMKALDHIRSYGFEEFDDLFLTAGEMFRRYNEMYKHTVKQESIHKKALSLFLSDPVLDRMSYCVGEESRFKVFEVGLWIYFQLIGTEKCIDGIPLITQRRFLENFSKILRQLKNHYNLSNFDRYPISLLLTMYDNIGKRQLSKPLALLAYPFSGTNGVSRDAFNSVHDILLCDNLSEYYDVRVVESENPVQFVRLLKRMKSKYGKSILLVIKGHGTPHSVSFGNTYISHSDVSIFRSINSILKKSNSTIILDSCSTGDPTVSDNIALNISSNVPRARVIAPSAISKLFEINLGNHGIVNGAKYVHESKPITTQTYLGGVSVGN